MIRICPFDSTCDYLQAPSPCSEYRVDHYTLVFVEEANSFGMEPFHVLNVSRFVDGDGPVSLMVNSSDGLLPDRQYNTTITAFNQAGSSESNLIVCKYYIIL